MKDGEVIFSQDTVSRNCSLCAKKSTGVVEGKNGDYIYKVPYCASHEEEVMKKVLQQIEA